MTLLSEDQVSKCRKSIAPGSLVSINRDQRVKLVPTLAPLAQRFSKTDVMLATRNGLVMSISC